MHKRIFLLGLCTLLLMFILAACNGDDENKNKEALNDEVSVSSNGQTSSVADMNKDLVEQSEHLDSTANTVNEQDSDEVVEEDAVFTISSLNSKIKVGTTAEEVVEFLGEAQKVVTSTFDGSPTWRYDITENESYDYDVQSDNPDMEGLPKSRSRCANFYLF